MKTRYNNQIKLIISLFLVLGLFFITTPLVSACDNFYDYDGGCDWCDYDWDWCDNPICTEDIVFTDWSSWKDVTECVDGIITQERTRTEYDANDCGSFEDKTHTETRERDCEPPICTEDIVFTDWSSWKDVTECVDGIITQERTRTEYDANDCGSFEDKIHTETRERDYGNDNDKDKDDKDEEFDEELKCDGADWCDDTRFYSSQIGNYSSLDSIVLSSYSKAPQDNNIFWWIILPIIGSLLLIFLILSFNRR